LGRIRIALAKTRPFLGGIALAVAVFLVPAGTTVLIPVAIWYAVRWILLA